jgi:predicted DNA-binding protein (UPF0278 family)
MLKDIIEEILSNLRSEHGLGWAASEAVREAINETAQIVAREVLRKATEDIQDLRDEHANIARHGNTPDDAYDRVFNYLQSLEEELSEVLSK